MSFEMICSQLKWAIWSEFPSCLLRPGLCGSMCFAVIPFCLCFSLLSQQPTIQLLLIRPVLFIAHSSAEAFLSLCSSAQPDPVTNPMSQSPVSVLRFRHGGEDQADETEDEQVQAGSRFRLQTGAGLPQGKKHVHVTLTYASLAPVPSKHALTVYSLHGCTWLRPYGTLCKQRSMHTCTYQQHVH